MHLIIEKELIFTDKFLVKWVFIYRDEGNTKLGIQKLKLEFIWVNDQITHQNKLA